MSLGRIMVGLDGSEQADAGLSVAISMAHAQGARLDLASVVPDHPAFSRHPDEAAPLIERLQDDASDALSNGQARVEAEGLDSRTHRLEGYPAEAICRWLEDREPDLAMLGHRGLSAQELHLVGSVGYTVAQFSPCPVLLTRSEQGPTSFLVAVDGSDAAARAARLAGLLAEPLDGQVILMFVIPQGTEEVKFTVTRSYAEPFLTPLTQELSELGIDVTKEVAYGYPAETLIETAAELGTDALVMGRVGRAGPAGFSLGGVTDKVLHHADASVLVVP